MTMFFFCFVSKNCYSIIRKVGIILIRFKERNDMILKFELHVGATRYVFILMILDMSVALIWSVIIKSINTKKRN